MKPVLAAVGLALALIAPMAPMAHADAKSELSAPIVAFTGVIKKNADALGLTAEQRADLKAWIETMPVKRKAVEEEALAARAALRLAIIEGAPKDVRAKLAERVGAFEVQLVTMRSNCTDHWREVLSAEQFAKMLDLAAAQ